jgi:uncharacterized surface protein with fasciclin (FAS1) repeats
MHRIAEIACATNGFNILCQALEKTGLYDNLDNSNDHFTVFAPGDSAFRDILNDHLYYDDIQHCPLDVLKQILLLHVRVNDVIYKDDLEDRCGDLLRMASGDDTRTVCEHHEHYGKKIFQKGGGNSENGKPKIVTFNIDACNGVIHVVDQVILPTYVHKHYIPNWLTLLSYQHSPFSLKHTDSILFFLSSIYNIIVIYQDQVVTLPENHRPIRTLHAALQENLHVSQVILPDHPLENQLDDQQDDQLGIQYRMEVVNHHVRHIQNVPVWKETVVQPARGHSSSVVMEVEEIGSQQISQLVLQLQMEAMLLVQQILFAGVKI